MYDIKEEDINVITRPMALFTLPKDLDPTELTNKSTTPDEIYRDNGASPPYVTQPSLLRSPLTDALIGMDDTPPRPRD